MNYLDSGDEVHEALIRLERWIANSEWKAYDPFDGLSSPYARYFTFGNGLLKQCWLQGVRRFPINLRPLLGITRKHSTKAMGFFLQGYLRLYQSTGRPEYREKMRYCFDWLLDHRSQGYKGYGWGNQFGGQTRGGFIAKDAPTVVWTSLIGNSFVDAYEALNDEQYANAAIKCAELIAEELGWMEMETGICLRYFPGSDSLVHNSSMLGAGLLGRVSALTSNKEHAQIAEKAMRWSVSHQLPNGAWYYGVGEKWKWIDSFHTGYNLESLHAYCVSCEDERYLDALHRGYKYFIETFFEEDGTPRYYDYKTRPLDIQCSAQAIQTLVNLRALDSRSVDLACRVARWTIENMQDSTGYFYFRKYPFITNKTPTLHWGQGTMFAALGLLNHHLQGQDAQRGTAAA
jgi:rhamnogalacturonyl hydrolase YesR